MAFTGVFRGLLYNSRVFMGHEYGNFHTTFMTQINAFFYGIKPMKEAMKNPIKQTLKMSLIHQDFHGF